MAISIINASEFHPRNFRTVAAKKQDVGFGAVSGMNRSVNGYEGSQREVSIWQNLPLPIQQKQPDIGAISPEEVRTLAEDELLPVIKKIERGS